MTKSQSPTCLREYWIKKGLLMCGDHLELQKAVFMLHCLICEGDITTGSGAPRFDLF